MTPSRLRLVSLAAIVAGAGLVSLAWSQPWFALTISGTVHEVPGAVAGGALLPLALASLALVAALALAGPVFRVILGVLDALLGVCVVAVSAWALGDPVAASLPFLVEETGIGSAEALAGDLTTSAASAWPFVAIVAGALVILTGVTVAATARAWPASGSRYSRSRLATPEGDAIHDWDALSEGDDPTAGPR